MGGGSSKSKYIDPEEETRRLLDGEDADGNNLSDDDESDDDGSVVGEVGGARMLDLRDAAQQRQSEAGAQCENRSGGDVPEREL